MLVGEPSLMGGDFGEEDERLITRLENNQIEPKTTFPNSNNMLQQQQQQTNRMLSQGTNLQLNDNDVQFQLAMNLPGPQPQQPANSFPNISISPPIQLNDMTSPMHPTRPHSLQSQLSNSGNNNIQSSPIPPRPQSTSGLVQLSSSFFDNNTSNSHNPEHQSEPSSMDPLNNSSLVPSPLGANSLPSPNSFNPTTSLTTSSSNMASSSANSASNTGGGDPDLPDLNLAAVSSLVNPSNQPSTSSSAIASSSVTSHTQTSNSNPTGNISPQTITQQQQQQQSLVAAPTAQAGNNEGNKSNANDVHSQSISLANFS